MRATGNPPDASWWRAALVAAACYVVIGLATAALARHSAQQFWRFMAWALSAVVFAAHLLRERSARPHARGAWHATFAVMVATAVIAAAAIVHNLSRGPMRPAMVLAFFIWPLLTGVASFAVGYVALRMAPRPVS